MIKKDPVLLLKHGIQCEFMQRSLEKVSLDRQMELTKAMGIGICYKQQNKQHVQGLEARGSFTL